MFLIATHYSHNFFIFFDFVENFFHFAKAKPDLLTSLTEIEKATRVSLRGACVQKITPWGKVRPLICGTIAKELSAMVERRVNAHTISSWKQSIVSSMFWESTIKKTKVYCMEQRKKFAKRVNYWQLKKMYYCISLPHRHRHTHTLHVMATP